LSNGMEVLVAEARRFPVVSLSVMLPVSGVQEVPAQAGLAALTGDLLGSGAAGRSGLEIAQELEGLGVLEDSSVSWDSTHVGFTVLRSRVEPASRILSDLVLHPDFPEDEVERLRSERLAGISQRRAHPVLLANEVVMRFVFAPESPYSRALSGTARTVGTLTRQDVRAFHAAHYGSTGAAGIVAGDITPDEAAELLEQTFGSWPGAAAATHPLKIRRHEDAPRVVLVDRPGSVQAELRVGQVGISRTDPDYLPVTVMNHILGGAFSSRLNLSLRERYGYTYGASSSYTTRRGPGPFLVSTAVQSDAAAASVREIFGEVERIREAPVASEELDDARSYLAGVFPLRLETTAGLAARLSQIAVYGLPDDYFEHYRDRILEVSADDILRAARAHLRPREMVVVVVGDAGQLRGPLEDFGEVRVFDPDELEG
ncbi:MAG TPA: pitrilysin family protein, partial [Longimicrobiaceae bacterium]|nr:pitrilysin family protein [Longimicrobiaceae bacterium]